MLLISKDGKEDFLQKKFRLMTPISEPMVIHQRMGYEERMISMNRFIYRNPSVRYYTDKNEQ
jgi:hypothetical protein